MAGTKTVAQFRDPVKLFLECVQLSPGRSVVRSFNRSVRINLGCDGEIIRRGARFPCNGLVSILLDVWREGDGLHAEIAEVQECFNACWRGGFDWNNQEWLEQRAIEIAIEKGW